MNVEPIVVKNARDTPVITNPWNLSQREQAVLRLRTEGLTLDEIAAKLCLSVKTVNTYFCRAKGKMIPPGKLDLTSERCCVIWDRFERDNTAPVSANNFTLVIKVKNGKVSNTQWVEP